jgi:hypothetical protein
LDKENFARASKRLSIWARLSIDDQESAQMFRLKLHFKPGFGNDLIKLIALFSRMHPPIPEAFIFRFFFAWPILSKKDLLIGPVWMWLNHITLIAFAPLNMV